MPGALLAQNNALFQGGSGQGYSLNRITLSQHSDLFAGGTGNGYAHARISIPVHNAIFLGGNGRGDSWSYLEGKLNHAIFAGGIEDGASSVRISLPTNSQIFAGGSADGYAALPFAQPTHNSIFAGGQDDGYAQFRITGLPAALDPIFAIELLSFDAWPEEDQVALAWVTASEINHDYFEVERSLDARLAESLAQVQGLGGPQQVQAYDLIDPAPYFGTSFYRLKAVDKNGTVEYSSWVEVYVKPQADWQIAAFPNPTADQLFVRLEGLEAGAYTLRLFDLMGRDMGISEQWQADTGAYETGFSLAALPAGIYVLSLRAEQGGKSQAIRVKVMR